jgi:transposase-like protein
MIAIGRPRDRQRRRDWWRRQIERQRNGNATVADFCRQLGVSEQSFYHWKRRLHETPSAASPHLSARRAAPRSASAGIAAPAFVPVSIREPAAEPGLEIELANACVVRLHGTVDAKLLRTAIRAAGQLGATAEGGDWC